MSKVDSELPERLSSAGAIGLEERLLRAARNEQPARELSERMARNIGVALPAAGAGAATSPIAQKAAAASKWAASGSSLLPWISGTVAAALVVGGFIALRRPAAIPAPAPSRATPAMSQVSPTPSASAAAADEAPAPQRGLQKLEPSVPRSPVSSASQRSRDVMTANGLAEQVALVDAARAALASGAAERALSSVREYQATYPSGSFRPEVAALKIEALLKLGREKEARALADRFAATYGPGPLAERVGRLAGITAP